MADGLVDFVKFSATRAANGDLSSLVAVPPYREPYQIKANPDEVLLHVRDAANDAVWHRAWYQLAGGGQLTEVEVVDSNARSGEYGPLNTQSAISTVGAVIGGSVIDSRSTPIVLRDGSFGNADSVRASVFFPTVKAIQQLGELEDEAFVFAVDSLYIANGGGDTAGTGAGGLFQYAAGDSTSPDGVNYHQLVTLPGRLIRQDLEVQAQFIRESFGIFADAGGDAYAKLHALAKGAVGAEDAWMGLQALRGNDGKAYTDLLAIMRDRQVGEVPFMRARSYGDDDDQVQLLKPVVPPVKATKGVIPAGAFARVTADNRWWLNDGDRGLVEAIFADTDLFRAMVANLAGVQALTPDGWDDNERALVLGRDAAGDVTPFWYYWSSGSSATHDGQFIIKPDFHAGGAAWSEAGRFLLGVALTTATVATGGSGAYVVDAFKRPVIIVNGGGAIDDVTLAENDPVLLIRGDADVQVLHDGAKINLGGNPLTLTATNPTLVLQNRNGVNFPAGGALSAAPPETTVVALEAIANAINTAGKYEGKIVKVKNHAVNPPIDRHYRALGSATNSRWRPEDDQSGFNDIIPA